MTYQLTRMVVMATDAAFHDNMLPCITRLLKIYCRIDFFNQKLLSACLYWLVIFYYLSYMLIDSKRHTILSFLCRNLDGIAGCSVDVFPEERDLLNNLISAVCSIDPDIVVGWEIQLGSLGFLAERAAYLGIGLLKRISRTTPHELNHPHKVPVGDSSQMLAEASSADDVDDVNENDWSHTHASGIHVGGRIVLNLWRLMRAEVKLNNYSLEAVADEVLRRKIPLIPSRILNRWFATGPGRGRHRCIEYISTRARINLEIMNQLDLVN